MRLAIIVRNAAAVLLCLVVLFGTDARTALLAADSFPLANFSKYFAQRGLVGDFVSGFARDGNGDIWFTTGYLNTFPTMGPDVGGGRFGVLGSGVSRYDGRQFYNYNTSNGLPDNTAQAILWDGATLWVGTASGLARGTGSLTGPSVFQVVSAVPGQVSGLLLDSFGTLWVSTLGNGIYRVFYNGSGVTAVNNYTVAITGGGLVDNRVTGMSVQNASTLWFATDGGACCGSGLRDLNAGGASSASISASSASFLPFNLNGSTLRASDGRLTMVDLNRLYDIEVDQSGNIWFSIFNSGIARLNTGSLWRFFDSTNGTGSNNVALFEEDFSGNIWMAYAANGIGSPNKAATTMIPAAGLSDDSPAFDIFTQSDGFESPHMIAIYFQDTATAWFGYQGSGANRLGGPVEQPGFPVTTNGYVFTSAPVLADLDNDGDLEVIVGDQSGRVFAFRPDGTTLWTYDARNAFRLAGGETLGDISVQSSPAVGDVDGDGRPEVVFGVGGFAGGNIGPKLDNLTLGQGALVILEHDGTLKQSVMAYDITNGLIPFSPRDGFREGFQGAPALANLDSDPELEIVAGALDNFIYAINGDGTPVFSVNNDGDGKTNEDFLGDFSPYTPIDTDDDAPGIKNVDDDMDGQVDEGNAFDDDEDGLVDEDYPEWPFHATDTTVSSAAVADIDGDGLADVVIGHDSTGFEFPRGGVLEVLSREGSRLAGWARGSLDQVVWSSPALGDLDGDGFLEIFHGTGLDLSTTTDVLIGQQFFAWNHNNTRLITPSLPDPSKDRVGLFAQTEGRVFSSPALGDVDGDGTREIVFVSTFLDNKDGNPINQSGQVVSGANAVGQLLYVFRPDGTLLSGFPIRPFPFIPNTAVLGSPAIIDVNNDGRQDIVLSVGWGVLAIDAVRVRPIDGFGVFQNLYDSDSQVVVASSAAVGDIDQDGRLEIVWGSAKRPSGTGLADSGIVHVYEAGANNTNRDWPMFRRTANRTGALTIQVVLPQAIPNTVDLRSAGSANVKLTAQVLAGLSAITSVTINGSQLGLGTVTLNDSGTNGDVAANDSYYSRDVTISNSVAGGQFQLPLTATGVTSVSSVLIVNVIRQDSALPKVLPASVDFGTLFLGFTADRGISVTNGGNAALTITGFSSNLTDYTLITPAATEIRNFFSTTTFDFPWTIPPGGSRPVGLRFKPQQTGARNATLTFAVSAGSPITLSVTGFVDTSSDAQINLNATALNFLTVEVGAESSRQLNISNAGTTTLTVTSITFGNTSFTVPEPSLPRSILPGSSVNFQIKFTPPWVGNHNTTMTIISNASNGTSKTVDLTAFATSGNGGLPATGYVMLGNDGGVFNFGSSTFFGSLPALGITPNKPLTVIKNTATELGYYMMGLDGGVFAFGDATFFGSLPQLGIVNETIDIEPTSTGQGYYVLGRDGGIFAFGDSKFYGSLPGLGIVNTALDMELTPTGKGYWIMAVDGGIFSFGDAQFFGSLPALGVVPNKPLRKIKSSPTGRGYFLIGEDGGLFAFGDSQFYGSLPGSGISATAVDLEITPTGSGYYILGNNGKLYRFGIAPNFNDVPGAGVSTVILDMDVNNK